MGCFIDPIYIYIYMLVGCFVPPYILYIISYILYLYIYIYISGLRSTPSVSSRVGSKLPLPIYAGNCAQYW